ncbi:MAG TPA: hypothetical protein PKB10_04560, partial [Tepidisphaeraceae bacterium]|nr:hypothetical protein [Tepidisphaeraceae bacterium]
YAKFHDLPKRVQVPMSLAVGGHKHPADQIRADGWNLIDAAPLTRTPDSYMRFIADSRGEWSVAKNVFVAMRTGWFSCRTACYLAAGRPAVVQETGWSRYVPAGNGVLSFSTMDEAISGIERVEHDYAAHRQSAYEIAREYLAPDRVLPQMLDTIFGTPTPPTGRDFSR